MKNLNNYYEESSEEGMIDNDNEEINISEKKENTMITNQISNINYNNISDLIVGLTKNFSFYNDIRFENDNNYKINEEEFILGSFIHLKRLFKRVYKDMDREKESHEILNKFYSEILNVINENFNDKNIFQGLDFHDMILGLIEDIFINVKNQSGFSLINIMVAFGNTYEFVSFIFFINSLFKNAEEFVKKNVNDSEDKKNYFNYIYDKMKRFSNIIFDEICLRTFNIVNNDSPYNDNYINLLEKFNFKNNSMDFTNYLAKKINIDYSNQSISKKKQHIIVDNATSFMYAMLFGHYSIIKFIFIIYDMSNPPWYQNTNYVWGFETFFSDKDLIMYYNENEIKIKEENKNISNYYYPDDIKEKIEKLNLIYLTKTDSKNLEFFIDKYITYNTVSDMNYINFIKNFENQILFHYRVVDGEIIKTSQAENVLALMARYYGKGHREIIKLFISTYNFAFFNDAFSWYNKRNDYKFKNHGYSFINGFNNLISSSIIKKNILMCKTILTSIEKFCEDNKDRNRTLSILTNIKLINPFFIKNKNENKIYDSVLMLAAKNGMNDIIRLIFNLYPKALFILNKEIDEKHYNYLIIDNENILIRNNNMICSDYSIENIISKSKNPNFKPKEKTINFGLEISEDEIKNLIFNIEKIFNEN